MLRGGGEGGGGGRENIHNTYYIFLMSHNTYEEKI